MNSFAFLLRSFGPARLASTAAVTLLVFGIMIWIITSVSKPHMSLLFSGLELTDSNKIIQRLETMNVPYEILGEGSTIKVPEEDVTRIRIAIAGEGLNGGGSIGFEIFDRDTALGTTSFVQNINHTRALEGELERTITALETVASARVHLVLPKRRLFSRENQLATASIFIKTRNSRPSAMQIKAIQNLVAGAVPDLSPERISIVDQKGSLLARGTSGDEGSLLATSLEEKKIGIENRLRSQIESLLEKTLGAGKVKAEVTAELDMNRITTRSETYDPDGAVLISSNTTESTTSNIDNQEQEDVSIAANLPDNQQTGTQVKSQNTGNTNSEVLNYLNSKTSSVQVHEAGTIKKISVAVLVDGTYSAAVDGAEPAYIPQTDAVIEQLNSLVKSAIGYDEERGDIVEVINLKFAKIDFGDIPEEPGLFSFNKGDMLRLIEGGVAALVALMLIFLVLRPLIKRMTETPDGDKPPRIYYVQGPDGGAIALPPGQKPTEDQVAIPAPKGAELAAITDASNAGDDGALSASEKEPTPQDLIDIAAIEGRIEAATLKKVGELVEKHPDESVAVVRQWLYS